MKNRYFALWLCGIITLIFIFQLAFPSITDSFKLVSSDVLTRPWILLTSVFLHSGILHLLYNLFALAMFGIIVEAIIGSRKFLLLFIASGAVASAASCFLYYSALGASGAIFGIMGCLVLLRPRGIVLVYGMPLPLWLAAFVWAAFDIAGLFAPSSIANLAHLAGLTFGLCYGLALRRQFAKKPKVKEKIKLTDADEKLVRQWEDHYMLR